MWDEAEAERAIAFFGLLPHIKGEWANEHRLLVLEPWECFIVGSLFGWKRRDGFRRFRTAYHELGRKNGKSSLAAGVGLKLAFFDGETGAEVFCAATKRDQAKIVWGDARQMVLKTPGLRKRIRAFVGNLHSLESGSKFEPLGADADTMDGLNIHGSIVDELHAHPNRKVVDALETATAARRQPLTFYITTAGYDRQSVCWHFHEYSRNVLEGTIEDDTFFAYIAALDEGDDWTDPRVWIKANPNLGISVKLDDLERKCERAKEIPAEQNAFRRLHCNQWVEQQTRWLDVAMWDEAGEPVPNPEALRGKPCYGGLDLASTTDLAALCLLFTDGEGGYDALWWCWCPEEGIRKRGERDRVPYDVWERQGYLTATPGNIIDYDRIRETIRDLSLTYQIKELGYDPWAATQLVTQLSEDGATCVPIRQGFASLSAPTKEFEKLVLGRKLRHGGNPIARWCVGNVMVEQDAAGNMKPSKAKSTERIDLVSAVVNALARAIVAVGAGASVYEERDLVVL